MGQADDIKIRALPRGAAKETVKKEQKSVESEKSGRRWIIYVVTLTCGLVLGALVLAPSPKSTAHVQSGKATGQADLASVDARVNETVTRHMQDSEIQHEMMMHLREMENKPFQNAGLEPNQDEIETLPENRSLGVQLDSEDSSEKVFADLQDDPVRYSDTLPADRINARLAKRKWVNETERAERIQFISNFIRSAYERGYEVEIDPNLVVVGVKRVSNTTQKVNINQVIDRLAKQGY